jgi:hypothetical protein
VDHQPGPIEELCQPAPELRHATPNAANVRADGDPPCPAVATGAYDVAEGDVVRRRICVGSKSERDAVILEMGDHFVALRRRGGNAFSDPALDVLVGHHVRVRGTATATTFLIDRYDVMGPANATSEAECTPSD